MESDCGFFGRKIFINAKLPISFYIEIEGYG